MGRVYSSNQGFLPAGITIPNVVHKTLLILTQLSDAIEKYHITADNIYNVDEKGFLIGQGHATRRIINKEARKTGKILGINQDGGQEFVTLVACVRATGSYIPPTLIYQGQSHDLLDTWVQDLNDTEAYFAVSEKGWTNNDLGLQ